MLNPPRLKGRHTKQLPKKRDLGRAVPLATGRKSMNFDPICGTAFSRRILLTLTSYSLQSSLARLVLWAGKMGMAIQRTARIAKRAIDTANNSVTPPRESAFKRPLES